MAATGEIIQYTFIQVYDGQQMETVLHFREQVAGATDAQLKGVADAWLFNMKLLQVTTVTYPLVIIKRMTPVPFDEILHTPLTTTTGAVSASGHNSTIAVVATKRTGVAGKSHRGRLYVGGTPSGWGTDRLNIAPGPATFGTWAGLVTSYWGPGGSDPVALLGIYSRSIGGSHPFTLAGWQQMSRLDVQQIYGNQRRRRVGVGI